jgi:hypothetical protein
MSSHPSPIISLKLRVTQGSNMYEQVIPSSSPETTNSFPITNQTFPELLNAFNSEPEGTIFNPSIVATYAPGTFATGDVLSTPSTQANFVPRQITPTFLVANIPDKTTADEPFSVADLVTKTGTGVVSYSSSAQSVATINSSSGLVTIAGAGVTDITFSLAASADGVYKAAAPITKTLTVTSSGWTQRGQDIDGEEAGDNSGYSVSLSANGTIVAIGAIVNDDNGSYSGSVRVYEWNGTVWVQRGQDINGEATNDESGTSVSLSANGTRVAIGSPYNSNNNGLYSGSVRVYEWNGTAWVQLGLDIDGGAADDLSGHSVSLSANGTRVAIGAYNRSNNNGLYSGSVRVYEWNGTAWMQLGLDIDGKAEYDYSGRSVSLSADGTRVAIGAYNNSDNGSSSGSVRVYEWNNTTSLWVQRGQDINGEAAGDNSGRSVSISADGTIVAIGAIHNSDNGSSSGSGSVRVYEWNNTTSLWVQRGQDINGEAADDNSGWSVSISADGTIVAIGAPNNDGNGSNSGSVRVYVWNNTVWVQRGQDINGEAADDNSGWSVSISADGTIVAIGAPNNSDNGSSSGSVRVFEYQ